jgi:uncharacterized protein
MTRQQNQGNNRGGNKGQGKGRGFAAMDKEEVRRLASEGGKARAEQRQNEGNEGGENREGGNEGQGME